MSGQKRIHANGRNGTVPRGKARRATLPTEGEGGPELPAIPAAAVKPREIAWLSRGRLALGTFTLIDGSKGTGKSALACTIAAAVTGGPALPDQEVKTSAHVLWFAGEEDLGLVVRKLRAARANLLKVHFPGRSFTGGIERELVLPGMVEALDACIVRHGAALVVLDPLAGFVGGCDLNQEQPCRALTSPLSRIAEERGVCFLAIRHPRKTPVGSAIDRGLGNPALAAAARSVLATGTEPETGERLLGVVRCNLGRPAATLGYSLADSDGVPVVRWGAESNLDAERFEGELLDGSAQLQRLDARLLLRLRIGSGWVQAADVIAEARRNGISQDALDRARWRLGVRSKRVGKVGVDGHWIYGAPEGGWPHEADSLPPPPKPRSTRSTRSTGKKGRKTPGKAKTAKAAAKGEGGGKCR